MVAASWKARTAERNRTDPGLHVASSRPMPTPRPDKSLDLEALGRVLKITTTLAQKHVAGTGEISESVLKRCVEDAVDLVADEGEAGTGTRGPRPSPSRQSVARSDQAPSGSRSSGAPRNSSIVVERMMDPSNDRRSVSLSTLGITTTAANVFVRPIALAIEELRQR